MCIRDSVHTVEALKAFFSSALYDQNLEDAIMDALLDTADFKDVLPCQGSVK